MEMKTEIALLAMNVGYAGMNILMRVALAQGMNQFVFVTYRQIIAVIAIAPIAYFKEKRVRPPMTVAMFFQIFMLALLGITFTQNFFLTGVYYTGPTFSAAMTNLIPACTFVLAVIFRLEEINIKTLGGKAKVIGTLGCVGGAMVMTFYKGPSIILLTSQPNSYILLGSCALVGKVLSWSAWLILQVYVIKRYPAHLSMVTIMMVLGALQSGGVALVLAGTKTQIWSLGWNMTTLTYLYSLHVRAERVAMDACHLADSARNLLELLEYRSDSPCKYNRTPPEQSFCAPCDCWDEGPSRKRPRPSSPKQAQKPKDGWSLPPSSRRYLSVAWGKEKEPKRAKAVATTEAVPDAPVAPAIITVAAITTATAATPVSQGSSMSTSARHITTTVGLHDQLVAEAERLGMPLTNWTKEQFNFLYELLLKKTSEAEDTTQSSSIKKC